MELDRTRKYWYGSPVITYDDTIPFLYLFGAEGMNLLKKSSNDFPRYPNKYRITTSTNIDVKDTLHWVSLL